MREFTVAEARNRLHDPLHMVESSGSVQISRGGNLVRWCRSSIQARKRVLRRVLMDFRATHDLGGLDEVFASGSSALHASTEGLPLPERLWPFRDGLSQSESGGFHRLQLR